MWSDLENEGYWKTVACVSIFAVATVHVCLLSVARLAGRFRWVFFIACQVILGLALLLSITIIWEIEEDRLFRFLAAVAIVDGALTLVIPLLHRISRSDDRPGRTMTALDERNADAIEQEIDLLRRRILALEKLRSEIAGRNDMPHSGETQKATPPSPPASGNPPPSPNARSGSDPGKTGEALHG
jgi:hypothetical protein